MDKKDKRLKRLRIERELSELKMNVYALDNKASIMRYRIDKLENDLLEVDKE